MKYLFPAILLFACAPSHEKAEWSVSVDGSTVTSSTHWHTQHVADFPVGFFLWWDCAEYKGELVQVYVNEKVSDGRWVRADAMPVATGPCYDPSVTCPDNCVEGP